MLKSAIGVVVFAVLTIFTSLTAQRGCQDVGRAMTHWSYYPIRDMRTSVAIMPNKVALTPPDSASVPITGRELPVLNASGKPLAGGDLGMRLGAVLHNPTAADDSSIARGQRKFMRTCVPCHGPAMKGDGPVAARFMPPPDLLKPMTRERPDGYIYSYIRNGGAIMPSYGAQVTAKEAWDLVNYLRHMQKTNPR